MATVAPNSTLEHTPSVNLDSKPFFSDGNGGIFAWIGLLSLFVVYQNWRNGKRVISVPAECVYGFLPRYIGAYKFLNNARRIIDASYQKYQGGSFKVPFLGRWTVVISKPELIEEIKSAPDDKISITDALVDIMAVPWTIGENIATRHYHLEIIRQQLTRCLAARFDDIKEEIAKSFEEFIPPCDNEWVPVTVLPFARKMVPRTSNRVFVGLPLCRNPEYVELTSQFAISVIETGVKIQKLPAFLRPILGPLVTTAPPRIRQAEKLLSPLIEERRRQYEEHGLDWPDKPNDMLTWIMENAPKEEQATHELARRMLWINFAAIHTTSSSFTHALFHLAAEPEKYMGPLREEVEQVIAEEGWTKVAMTKMWKLDSFMKESQRYNGINMLSMNRKVMADYTLSDGTFLPKGSFVSINTWSNHFEDNNYDDAAKFNGFRFADIRGSNTDENAKHQMVSTSNSYLAFGHGRHACPGRFFAVNELKAMMAYVIQNFDVKMEHEGVRPKSSHVGTRIAPNPTARVLFKKRVI